jgi:hypothetical protein
VRDRTRVARDPESTGLASTPRPRHCRQFLSNGDMNNMLRKAVVRGRALLLVLVVSGTFLGLQASPALASSSSCTVGFLHTSCKTSAILPNPNGNWFRIRACAPSGHYTDWQLKRNSDGYIRDQGRVAAGSCMEKIVYVSSGTYYYMWVFNTRQGASALITTSL